MRARIKLGIAMAAMIRMIATTISSSISEKPLCFRMEVGYHICASSLRGTESDGTLWAENRFPAARRVVREKQKGLDNPNHAPLGPKRRSQRVT
jgi:hypothetical protein